MSVQTAFKGRAAKEPPPAPAADDTGLLELTLSDNGMICACSKACGKCLGCTSRELLWQHVSVLLPQLQDMPLMQNGQINPRLRFLSHIGRLFILVGHSGKRFMSEVFFNDIESLGRHYLHLVIRPVRSMQSDPFL